MTEVRGWFLQHLYLLLVHTVRLVFLAIKEIFELLPLITREPHAHHITGSFNKRSTHNQNKSGKKPHSRSNTYLVKHSENMKEA